MKLPAEALSRPVASRKIENAKYMALSAVFSFAGGGASPAAGRRGAAGFTEAAWRSIALAGVLFIKIMSVALMHALMHHISLLWHSIQRAGMCGEAAISCAGKAISIINQLHS